MLALFALIAASSFAADPPAPPRRELWVPSKHFGEVQKQHPNAVFLTPDQYAALIRDACIVKPEADPALKPPVNAVIDSMTWRGSIDPASDLATLTGELSVRSFSDELSELTIELPFDHLTSAVADTPGRMALSAPDQAQPKAQADAPRQRKLLLRGKGTHHLYLEATEYLATLGTSGRQALTITTVGVPGTLELKLPANAEVLAKAPRWTRGSDGTVRIGLHHGIEKAARYSFAWSVTGTGIDRRFIAESNRNRATVQLTPQTINAQWTVWLEQLGRAAGERTFTLDLTPAETAVADVRGRQLARWQQRGSQLDITVNADHGTNADFAIALTAPLNLSDTAQPVRIPAVRQAQQITRSLNADITALDPDIALIEITGGQITDKGLRWLADADAPQLVVRRAKPRVIVDADALVRVSRDDISIEHTLGISTDRPVNELRVTLPANEVFDDTAAIQGPPLEWKRNGQTLEYRWPNTLTSAVQSRITLRTRLRRTGTAAASAISPLVIPDATKLAGYVALDYDTTWRVNVTDATGLEERDVKLTPVKGRIAWFCLRDFRLSFTTQRRDPVFDLDAIAYALPRAHSVEIEGQFTLRVSEAPLRRFQVQFSKEQAAAVRFTSANIAERQLDPNTGVWTLTLREELLGAAAIRWAISLEQGAASNQDTGLKSQESQLLTTTLPQVSASTARKFTGQWIIEANTDTEITFDAKAMQTRDIRRVPLIEGYTPRHRIVGAYAYAAPEAALTLHAARHGHSELAAVVVREIALITVLASDGSTRHQATLSVQHSGEQFLNVKLPAQATLLSTLAADQPVKPVRGPDGALSIPLPAGSANQPDVRLQVLYETQGQPWTSTGQRPLQPLTLPDDVPVLATTWDVYAPEGFDFAKAKTEMEQVGTDLPVLNWKRATAKLATAPFSTNSTALTVHLPKFDSSGRIDYAERLSEQSDTEILETARQMAASGQMDRARLELSLILREYPHHAAALALQKQLADPDRYPPALTPEHVKQQEVVTRSLQKANSQFDLGDYDSATKEFESVLRADPYNVAARRGLERVERAKTDYIASARDHTRARMLADVSEGWDEKDPAQANSLAGAVQERVRMIRFPVVQFQDATIEEAVEFLRMKSRDLDPAADPAQRGVNIVLKAVDVPSTARISLDLKDVPMDEALRYVTELAGMRYRIEGGRIVIEPVVDSQTEMFTRSYRLPPAPAVGTTRTLGLTAVLAKYGAQAFLTGAGVPFPDGATVQMDAGKGELVVKNTAPNLDLVQAIIDSSRKWLWVTAEGGQIVGRVAFWDDDETAKANVDTAGKAIGGVGFKGKDSAGAPVDLNQPMSPDATGKAPQFFPIGDPALATSGATMFGLPRINIWPEARKSGLMSLALEIPASGQHLRFRGLQSPEVIDLHYTSWEAQWWWAVAFMLLGAGLFLWRGRAHPWLGTALAVLLLVWGAGLVNTAWQPRANAVLIGWGAALVLWLIARAMAKLETLALGRRTA